VNTATKLLGSYETGNFVCLVARFEVYTTMEIQTAVVWIVSPCSDVVRYQLFGGPGCMLS
jgi:hypothetical protein